ncbi:MAG: glycogen synthase GlgA, partial [Ignavibacteriaceae bacterium]
MATTEAVPFAKTGGLADVCGSLPIELANLGHEVMLFMPAFKQVFEVGAEITSTDVELEIPIGNALVRGRILTTKLPQSDVPVYFIEQHEFFGREGLYGNAGGDYRDNCQRFVFFCRGVLEAIRLLELNVDIIHCNDWQTGLIPAYLQTEYRTADGYEVIATLFTIHNLAYQGRFWHWDMLLTGLDWKYFNWQQLEYFGDLSLLKSGIVFADAISTVSVRYADEIQRPDLGCGLETVLSHRRDVLTGILNGVDYSVWNPETDPHLPRNYNVKDWQAGKAACKAALQQRFGLEQSPHVPLIGFIGRLAEQKGAEIIIDLISKWVHQRSAQWIILGTGDERLEERFTSLSAKFPKLVGAQLAFANETAHLIEAAADMFLMPSRYEPCGLNQMYSLRYGTVPVVHATGGLYDTITDCNEDTLATETANGFSFSDFSTAACESALARAYDTYQNRRDAWEQLVAVGMRQDWSWRRSARQYVDLYQHTIARIKQTIFA